MKIAGITKSIFEKAKNTFKYDKFLEKERPSSLNSKLALQLIVAFSFLILSITNIIAKSYFMLALTALGFFVNTAFAFIVSRTKSRKLGSCSSIITCSLLFASFVVFGGNDGFACLWVVLLPLLSMVIMDFKIGFFSSAFFQLFLIVVFWTPVNEQLLYEYNAQFCLRFPLFFFVTFMLGFLLTASLRQTEYNEYKHLIELEEMNKKTLLLSRIDPLTKLANRRYSYEELESKFSAYNARHCIVLGDIDDFKRVNDICGHEFGDDVLIVISELITSILPSDYLKSRWGGEEFLFAANESPEVVFEQVEKLRKTISEHEFLFNSSPVKITMTFGISEYTNPKDITEAINTADKRMYAGKNKTKNCTVFN